MNSKMKKLLVNAAMAGMIAGVGTMGTPTASAATNPSETVRNGCGGKDGCGGKKGDEAKNASEHHAWRLQVRRRRLCCQELLQGQGRLRRSRERRGIRS